MTANPPLTVTFEQMPSHRNGRGELVSGGVRIIVPALPGFVRLAHGPHEIARALEDAWIETDCFAYARAKGEPYDVEPDELAPGPLILPGGRMTVCRDCHGTFAVQQMGRPPLSCPPCARKRDTTARRGRANRSRVA